MVNIQIKNKSLILIAAAILLFTIASASAAEDSHVLNDTLQDSTEDISTTIKSDDTTVIQGGNFSVTLRDENQTALSNKTVQFSVNDNTTNSTTDDDGIARLKIDLNAGTYTVNYTFSETGYLSARNSTTILVLTTSTSKITAANYTAYTGVKNTYTLTLTAGGTPLSGKVIVFKINGKTYSRTTNSQGKATLTISQAAGSYKLYYSYAGEENINATSGWVKITVKKGMPTKITKYYSTTYINKKAGYFKIKLTDSRGNVLKSKKVIFKLNGKTYTKKTNSKGIATIKVKLKTGSYTVKVTFKKTSVYNQVSKSFKITVKSKRTVNGGMWLFGRDMYSTSPAKLYKYGIKHIFLNFKALELYGQSKVEKWIKKANAYNLKVHLWMQVFYNSGWQNPVKNGKVNNDLINTKVKEAQKYAKIKGIAGVHFDYVRYPGTASKYSNSVNAINTFIKKATTAVHKINKNLIVSAAVMPEPSSMKSAYGQDIKTMGKYLDVIVPMAYKGNYNAGASWIKYVTNTFKKQSSKAKIWTGLQSYKSDSSLKKLSASELLKDAKAAKSGGATAVILFRFGLFNYINFSRV